MYLQGKNRCRRIFAGINIIWPDLKLYDFLLITTSHSPSTINTNASNGADGHDASLAISPLIDMI
jgi:hypothetical protein